MLCVTNLKKKYGNFTAVDGISFSVAPGEIFGFLGPNGAGKTSTIHMLVGLSRPTSGSISIDHMDGIKEIKKVQRIIGVVGDESNLYDEMDGFNNLCFCASLYGMPKKQREKRARELLEQFGLTNVGKRPFKAYSKGMRRKLTIAAGIIHHPKILFLDEPTTGIDVESARQIRQLILEMGRRGTTVFLTTHYIEEAQRICDRVAFLVAGKIVKSDTVEVLLKNTGSMHVLQLALSRDIALDRKRLQDAFPALRFEVKGKDTCLLTSPDQISLSPVLEYLEAMNVAVYEAREMHPTLEDVFVRVTGIETEKLQKEKKGGGK